MSEIEKKLAEVTTTASALEFLSHLDAKVTWGGRKFTYLDDKGKPIEGELSMREILKKLEQIPGVQSRLLHGRITLLDQKGEAKLANENFFVNIFLRISRSIVNFFRGFDRDATKATLLEAAAKLGAPAHAQSQAYITRRIAEGACCAMPPAPFESLKKLAQEFNYHPELFQELKRLEIFAPEAIDELFKACEAENKEGKETPFFKAWKPHRLNPQQKEAAALILDTQRQRSQSAAREDAELERKGQEAQGERKADASLQPPADDVSDMEMDLKHTAAEAMPRGCSTGVELRDYLAGVEEQLQNKLVLFSDRRTFSPLTGDELFAVFRLNQMRKFIGEINAARKGEFFEAKGMPPAAYYYLAATRGNREAIEWFTKVAPRLGTQMTDDEWYRLEFAKHLKQVAVAEVNCTYIDDMNASGVCDFAHNDRVLGFSYVFDGTGHGNSKMRAALQPILRRFRESYSKEFPKNATVDQVEQYMKERLSAAAKEIASTRTVVDERGGELRDATNYPAMSVSQVVRDGDKRYLLTAIKDDSMVVIKKKDGTLVPITSRADRSQGLGSGQINIIRTELALGDEVFQFTDGIGEFLTLAEFKKVVSENRDRTQLLGAFETAIKEKGHREFKAFAEREAEQKGGPPAAVKDADKPVNGGRPRIWDPALEHAAPTRDNRGACDDIALTYTLVT